MVDSASPLYVTNTNSLTMIGGSRSSRMLEVRLSFDNRTSHSRGAENYDPTARQTQDRNIAAECLGTAVLEVDKFVGAGCPPVHDCIADAVLIEF